MLMVSAGVMVAGHLLRLFRVAMVLLKLPPPKLHQLLHPLLLPHQHLRLPNQHQHPHQHPLPSLPQPPR